MVGNSCRLSQILAHYPDEAPMNSAFQVVLQGSDDNSGTRKVENKDNNPIGNSVV